MNSKKIRIIKKNESNKNHEDGEEKLNSEETIDEKMVDKDMETTISNNVNQEAEIFKNQFEEHLADIDSGNLVKGKVVIIDDSDVYIDIGFKSEGRVPKTEFRSLPVIGEEVEVFVVSMENDEGDIVLSKTKADIIKTKTKLDQCFQNQEPIEGKIVKSVKSGFIVDLGVEAFLPFSQLEIRKVSDTSKYIGNNYKFRITKYEKGKNPNIVVSRRILLEDEHKKEKEKFYETYKEGDFIMGSVKTIVDYGVFVEIGPLDGFVHISDLTWDHVKHPRQVVRVGDDLKAIILSIDKDTDRINIGVKQITEDPWVVFCREKLIGDVVNGTVTSLTDFGAFVKVAEGVEGLIHTSELSWTNRNARAKEILRKGNQIDAKILDIDKENRKLSLGLKQVLPNPWDTIDEKFPVGSRFDGKVVSVIDNGVFIELENNIEGFLSSNDIDWIKSSKPKDVFKPKQNIEVMVLSIDKENKRIALGRKQLIDNPYELFIKKNPKNSIVKGKISKIESYGAFVDLDENVVGLVHISNISNKRIESIDQFLKVGDEIGCVIVEVDLRKNKIGLSIKDYLKRVEQMDIEKYIIKNEDEQTATLGELINLDNLKGKDNG